MKIEKELLDKFDEVATEMRDCELELTTMQEKAERIKESLPDIEEKVQNAEQEKTQAIDDFCLNKCDQKTVDLRAEAYDQAMRKEKSAREILEVLGQKEDAAHEKLNRLTDERRRVESRIWNFLYQKIFEDAKAIITKKLHYVFVVNNKRSNFLIWEVFLNGIIKKPGQEDIKKYNAELDNLFKEAIGR